MRARKNRSIIEFTIILIVFLPFWSFTVQGQEGEHIDYGLLESFVEFHGIISQEYFDFENEGKNEGLGSFDTHYAYILADCAVRENIKGIIELKFDHGGEDVKIDRAYFDASLDKLFNIRAGKFYLPLLEEVKEYRPTGNKLISSNFPALMDPDIFRDTGVQIFGNNVLGKMELGYKFSITNGAILGTFTDDVWGGSFDESTVDINQSKALCGQINCKLNDTFNVQISSLICTPNWVFKDTVLQPTGTPGVYQEVTTVTPLGELDFNIYGSVFTVNRGPFEFKGIYEVGAMVNEAEETADMSYWAVQMSYRILQNQNVNYLDLAARYKVFDFELSVLMPGIDFPEKSTDTGIGIAYSPYENFTIKAEYQWRNEIDVEEQDNDGIMMV